MDLDRLPIGDIAIQRLLLLLDIDLIHDHHHVNVLRLRASQVKKLARLSSLLCADGPERGAMKHRVVKRATGPVLAPADAVQASVLLL